MQLTDTLLPSSHPHFHTLPSTLLDVCLVTPQMQCKLGTLSSALREALITAYPETTCSLLTVDEQEHDCTNADKVRYAIRHQNSVAYQNAARFLNASSVDVVCLQYGSGIYGGPGGGHLTGFVNELKKPLVTAFHMVDPDPCHAEQKVMEALFRNSASLVAPTQAVRDVLRECYEVPMRKIDVIPHGISDVPLAHPCPCKEVAGLAGRRVLLTCGHLEPHKGIEHVIKALPAVVRQHPEVLYVIMGATEPRVQDAEGEAYRTYLKQVVHDCDMNEHVLFVNRFVDDHELDLYIGAADVCLTPYDVESRSCSANLARMVGMGKAVISTPYTHARELLADGRGRLVRFASPMALAAAILDLLGDSTVNSSIRQRAWEYGRQMIWPAVAGAYFDCFQAAVAHHDCRYMNLWTNHAECAA